VCGNTFGDPLQSLIHMRAVHFAALRSTNRPPTWEVTVRARTLLVAGLVVAGAAGVGIPAALAGTTAKAAAPAAGYPMVLDADLTPGSVCDGPVTVRLNVYHPQGVAEHAAVEWRVRFGGETVGTGTVTMDRSVATAEVTVASPRAGEVLVDARPADGGAYGKVWRDRLPRGCDPVRVVSVGDSVVWNQGLDHEKKFSHLVAQGLGESTGRGYEHADYAISGAVLDAPDLPAGNNDKACLTERYTQDPDGDGEMELGEVTAQMPDVFCQLAKAGAAGHDIDLVIMNGCVNDLDPFFGVPLGITPGVEDLPAAVRRECSGIGAAAENPAKDVPYFSGAKVGYGGRGMRAAIEKAHSLPGRPKVLVADFMYPFTRSSLPVLRDFCTKRDLPEDEVARCQGALGGAAQRYEAYTRLSAEAYRQAAEEANARSKDGAYAVAADGLFTLDQSALGPDPKVWQDATIDEAYPLRKLACPEFSPTPAQCLSAAIGHPDIPGSRQYAENFLRNPRLRGWFGLGGKAVPVTVSPASGAPGIEVTLTTAASGGPYTWYFGDGTTAVTDAPKTTHVYAVPGPHLARVVTGSGALHEAAKPVVVTP
jgi:hypothetical protein